MSGTSDLTQILQELRDSRTVKQSEIARLAGLSASVLSRFERGVFVPKPEEAEALARAYGVSVARRREIVRLAELAATEFKRFTAHRNGPEIQEKIAAMSKTVKHIFTFQLTAIPGLLQSESWMNALLDSTDYDEAKRERWLAGRRDYQSWLDNPRHEAVQIIAAGTLLWCAGDPATMASQCDRLVELSQRPNVQLGVIKARTPTVTFPAHGFDVFGRHTAITGTLTHTSFMSDPPDVRDYGKMVDALTALAVFGDEAREVFRVEAETYRKIT